MTGIFSFKKILFFLALILMPVFAFAATTEKVSISDLGIQADNVSHSPSISSDGRYVVFSSFATNLLISPTNGFSQIFFYDRDIDTIELVSTDNLGNQGDANSSLPSVSSDGRYVAFDSSATNLVSGDTNGVSDIFVHDRQTDITERVSISSLGVQANSTSTLPSISSDGRYVVFRSNATNLVAGDTNGALDIFVYDRQTDTVERVSVSDLGVEADDHSFNVEISSDGRYVAFDSSATNLVSGDTNGNYDTFVYDRQTDTVERVSVDDLGAEGNSSSAGNAYSISISSDGRYVAFESHATNLVAGDTNGALDIFVYDRQTDTVERVSVSDLGVEGMLGSFSPSISSDGRYVAFDSYNTFVSGDTNGGGDIFVYDRNTDTIERVSVTYLNNESSGVSSVAALSSDRSFVAFVSDGSDLIVGDSNGQPDIFVRILNSTPTDISLSSSTLAENQPSGTTIGVLTTTDADGSDTHTYTLACTSPGADDSSFSISGGSLLSAAQFDYETDTSYSICIRTDDGNGGTYDENFTITISDVSDSGSSGSGPSNPPPTPVPGCTNSGATNYNSNATTDNGTCTYPPTPIPGCMDSTASNYNASATMSNGSCLYPPIPVPGCTDALADNYNSSATQSDGSCIYVEPVDPQDPVIPETPTFPNDPSSSNNTTDYDKVDSDLLNTSKEILGILDEVPKEVADTISIAGIALPFIFFVATQPATAASIPLRLWNIIPTLLGFKRKKRPWGTVYDSVTKQPLDPVYVKLTDMQGKEVATTITDIDGRFGFLVAPGTYRISANKDNYIFPSQKLFGKSKDELYENLYMGEVVTITNQDELLIKNIPMDSLNFNWNEFTKAENKKLMKFYSKRDLFFAKIANVVFYFGIVSSLVLMFMVPAPLNIIIFSIYVVVILLRAFGIRPKKPGYVIEKETGYPLSFGLIKIFSVTLQREVAHAVIGKTGKYYGLVPNGNYYMKIMRKTGEDTYQEVLQTDIFEVKAGYVGEKIQISL